MNFRATTTFSMVAGGALLIASAAAAQQPIGPGASVTGELTNDSERIVENDYYLDLYAISGEAGERVAIAMQSDDFDTLIEIGRMDDGEFQQIAVDDDGGEGLNSRLVFTFPETGDYVVRARTFGANATGVYGLTVTELAPPPPPPPPTPIAIGQTVTGELGMDSPAYETEYGPDRFYALYTVAADAGDTVTVTLRSQDFDAFLEVGAQTPFGFAVVQSDDDGAANDGEESLGLDSRVTMTFQQAGTLAIRATTLGGGATGAYQLTVE